MLLEMLLVQSVNLKATSVCANSAVEEIFSKTLTSDEN